jgi:DNA (cytosine-5)-methyltransferase 1
VEVARKPAPSSTAAIVDVFCGVGGLTHGFCLEHFHIAAGLDVDERCRYAYESNNGAPFIRADVRALAAEDVARLFPPGLPRVLVGCAPCQPFSQYNQKNSDPNWKLLGEFGRLAVAVGPDVISMENVPKLADFRGGHVFRGFVNDLVGAGYHVAWDVLFCPDFGVPQRRSRLVLLASRLGPISLPTPTHHPQEYRTVRQAIGAMPRLAAGEADPRDMLHRASRLSDTNTRRMRASRPGGTWRDWDPRLVAACHRARSGRTYPSVYGRMQWDEPAPTITTQFYGFGNGRFGHPAQDRAISLREGAILQTFPPGYAFAAPDEPVHFKRLGKLIGNAVPVELARAIARTVRSHLGDFTYRVRRGRVAQG